MSLTNIPAELKTCDTWVAWNWEKRDGNLTKPPYDLKSNGVLRRAAVDNPATWATFAVADEETSGLSPRFSGAGLVLPAGMAGVDLDGVLDSAEAAEPYALEILKHLGNPYCEISPSRNGLRAFCHVPNPPTDTQCQFKGKKAGVEKYGAEIYIGGRTKKYMTVTGEKFNGDGIPTPQNFDLAYFLISQFGDEKFKSLWMGDISAYGNDNSKADFALCLILAGLLNNDKQKIERVFSASVPGHREKWTDRSDYRERTIAAAIKEIGDASTPSSHSRKELEFHLPAATINLTHREYVVSPALGEKDGWFPLGAVSLLAGASGGSKTTLMLQLLIAQSIRAPFFGHETYGRSFLMLGADRAEDAHKRTMERMNMNITSIPFRSLSLAWDTAAAQAIINQIEATNPLPEIVFVEGVDMLVSEVNNIKNVSYFMHELEKIAQYYRVAIVGSLGSPKVKEGHGYSLTRDNLLGSAAWGRTAETVALLTFPQSDDTSGRRNLTIALRNGPSEKFPLIFQDGVLVVDTNVYDDDSNKSGQAAIERDWYQTQMRLARTDSTKKWWTSLDMETALHLSHATAYRHIQDAKAKNHIVMKTGQKNGRGAAAEYHWNESKTNSIYLAQQKQSQTDQEDRV